MKLHEIYLSRDSYNALQYVLRQRFKPSCNNAPLDLWLEQCYPAIEDRWQILEHLQNKGILQYPNVCGQWFSDHGLGYNLTVEDPDSSNLGTMVLLTELGQDFITTLVNKHLNIQPLSYEATNNNQQNGC